MNSAKKKRTRVNVHLCFRQFDCSVMWASRSHPWNCIPFDRWDTTKITSVIQAQTWRSNEQCFELREVDVLGSTQILLVVGSEGTGDVSKSVTVLVQAQEERVHWRIEERIQRQKRPSSNTIPSESPRPHRLPFKKKRRKSLAWHVVAGGEQSEKCFCTPSHPKCDILLGGLVEGVSKVPSTLAPRSAMAPISVFRLIRWCCSSIGLLCTPSQQERYTKSRGDLECVACAASVP